MSSASPTDHLDTLSLRSFSRANTRMGNDVLTTQQARVRHHGGPGTGRELIPILPCPVQVGPLIHSDEDGTLIENPEFGASASATDHLLAKMHSREAARRAYMQEVPTSEKLTPQTHSKANEIAFQSSPHSFEKSSARSLNKSESVKTGALFSPLVGKRAGTVGGGYGVGDGGGVDTDGGDDWYMFKDNLQPMESDLEELPFANFFPTDDLTGEGLMLRQTGNDAKGSVASDRSKGRRSTQSAPSDASESKSVSSLCELISDLEDPLVPLDTNEPSESRVVTPKGSLAQQLLSPTFDVHSPVKDVWDEPSPVDKSPSPGPSPTHMTPPHSALFNANDIEELSKPKGRFEPKHYVHSPSTPKSAARRASASGMCFV